MTEAKTQAAVNNVNVGKLRAFRAAVEKDPAEAKKQKVVEGTWLFEEGEPQFEATLAYQKGESKVSVELPPFAGGWGTSPDPLQFCLLGLGGCFATTFMAVATAEGVEPTGFKVRVEADLDLRKQLGIGVAPILQQVRFIVQCDGLPKGEVARLVELAEARCPGTDSLGRVVEYKIDIAP